MSDIKRIIDAMAALAAVLPGGPHAMIGLHDCDMATLQLFANEGATIERYDNDAREEEWNCATLRTDRVTVNAFSKHRPIARGSLSSDVVDAAIAQAEEAASS